jgi:hypothetical protein
MSEKYNPAVSQAIITNDHFLASFLHSLGCTLSTVQRNERNRVSFVFTGSKVRELRDAYRTGTVQLDIRSFRDSLHYIRRVMVGEQSQTMDGDHPEQRSIAHGSTKLVTSVKYTLTAQPQC